MIERTSELRSANSLLISLRNASMFSLIRIPANIRSAKLDVYLGVHNAVANITLLTIAVYLQL
jgi:hypothetical protein